MKVRRGWYVVWPDGTQWWGDCPVWASKPVAPGVKVVPIRIVGSEGRDCPECVTGKH